ncbi:MAG: hypothetical protein AAF488_11025, partial [Planctomycetota bacterium]
SIFSSENFRAYAALPRTTRALHAAILLVAGLVLVASSEVLTARATARYLGSPGTQVLAIGTSHLTRALDPQAFPQEVVKIDRAALDLAVAEAVVREHQARWPSLEAVVIEVDEFSLFSDTVQAYSGDLSELCGRFGVNAIQLPARDLTSLRDYRRLSSLWRGEGFASLWERNRLTIRNVVDLPDVAPSHTNSPSSGSLDAARRRVAYAQHVLFRGGAEKRFREANLPALLALVRHFEERGAAVHLVRFPLSSAYREVRPAEWDPWIEEAIRTVRAAHPEVQLWDDREGNAIAPNRTELFTDEDFEDVDHLTREAARRWTQLLAHRLAL